MKVGEIMIPVGEYVAVGDQDTLLEALLALEADRQSKNGDQPFHRDALVFGTDGTFRGKLTMVDVMRALEPNYCKLDEHETDHSTLTSEYVAKIFQRYDLWTDAIPTLCSRVAGLKVAEVMREPLASEFLGPDDDLEMAIHRYICRAAQPLLVRRDGRVVGVLRFSDVFDVVRQHILACRQ